MHYVPPQLGLITTVVIALIPGIALFLLLPSWVFTYFENWPYSISLYYSYVTTTTIGFGDYVPTFGPNQVGDFLIETSSFFYTMMIPRLPRYFPIQFVF